MIGRRCVVFLAPLLAITLILSPRGGATILNAARPTMPRTTTGHMSTRGMVDHLDFGGFGGGVNPQVNYNPYSPNALAFSYTFEPLYLFNSYSCSAVPWLATAYR